MAMTSWRPYPTPYFTKSTEAKAPPGPKVYANRRRLCIEPMEAGQFRLVDAEGRVYRAGTREEIEQHVGEELRRGKYRAR